VRLVPYVSKHHISPAVCVCTEFVVVSEQVSPQAGRGLCLHMSKRFTETAKWADPWFRALTSKQKCLWLWLCDNCDCAGVVPEVDWGLVSFQIGEPCTADDLASFGDRIASCERGFWIRKFVAFQWGYISEENPSMPQRGVIKALERAGIPLAKAIESLTKAFPKGLETLKDKDKDKDKKEDRVQGKEKEPEVDPVFDAFWANYPRKEGKGGARKAFAKLADKDRVIKAAAQYGEAVRRWPADDRQFVPHPATWLNDGRFEDDPTLWERKSASQPAKFYGDNQS